MDIRGSSGRQECLEGYWVNVEREPSQSAHVILPSPQKTLFATPRQNLIWVESRPERLLLQKNADKPDAIWSVNKCAKLGNYDAVGWLKLC